MINRIKPYYSHLGIGVSCLLIGSIATYTTTAKVSSSPTNKTQSLQYVQPAQAANTKTLPAAPPVEKVKADTRQQQEKDLNLCWDGYHARKNVKTLTDKALNDSLYDCQQMRPYLTYDHK